MLAADGFVRGEKNTVIAKELRVSVRSVERWRRSWREGGRQALRPSGPAKRPKVDDQDFAVLERLLLAGAMAQGWADERWTLARVRLLVADQLSVSLSIHGVWELLRRHGWSCQQPTRRAIERDDAAVAGWLKETWPRAKPKTGKLGLSGLARGLTWERSPARTVSVEVTVRGGSVVCSVCHRWGGSGPVVGVAAGSFRGADAVDSAGVGG